MPAPLATGGAPATGPRGVPENGREADLDIALYVIGIDQQYDFASLVKMSSRPVIERTSQQNVIARRGVEFRWIHPEIPFVDMLLTSRIDQDS